MNNQDLEDRLNGLHDYSPSLDHPELMEHILILTEDGEPMLNLGMSLYNSATTSKIKAIINSRRFKSSRSDEPRRMQVLDLYCLAKFESEVQAEEKSIKD